MVRHTQANLQLKVSVLFEYCNLLVDTRRRKFSNSLFFFLLYNPIKDHEATISKLGVLTSVNDGFYLITNLLN